MVTSEKFDDALHPYGLVQLGRTVNHERELPGNQIVIVGNAGPQMWQAFRTAPEYADGGPDRLNRWTRRVLSKVATDLEIAIRFPFDGPPYFPFQQWMLATGAAFQSPIGLLIHPEFGLWFAMRGAFLVEGPLAGIETNLTSPCDTCANKPCLLTCPVSAFSPEGYDVPGCKAHLATPQGEDCMSLGCRARRACPVGTGHHYGSDQARLHMTAFRD